MHTEKLYYVHCIHWPKKAVEQKYLLISKLDAIYNKSQISQSANELYFILQLSCNTDRLGQIPPVYQYICILELHLTRFFVGQKDCVIVHVWEYIKMDGY